MHKLCEYIDEELMELERKAAKGQKLNAAEIEYGDKLAHFKKSLLTNDAMEGEDYSGYDGSYARDGRGGSSYRGSYARGSYARRRDSRGRYSSDGYSRDGEMMSELHMLMDDAPDERTRQEFQRFISKIESM